MFIQNLFGTHEFFFFFFSRFIVIHPRSGHNPKVIKRNDCSIKSRIGVCALCENQAEFFLIAAWPVPFKLVPDVPPLIQKNKAH